MKKDDKIRCAWAQGTNDELYIDYIMIASGVYPAMMNTRLIEMLILESFHAGLSWLIILKKREAFKKAFDNYDLKKIADYGEDKFQELMNDASIVRNRLKIAATITNACKNIGNKEGVRFI